MNCECQKKITSSLSLHDQQLTGSLTNQLTIEGNLLLQNNSISSSLSPIETITGTIENVENTISGQLSIINTISGKISNLKTYPVYNGAIEITPIANLDILLETEDKIVTDNIIVHEIPYYQTSNLSGGYTVIIG